MFLYLLKCSDCPRVKNYKSGIAPENLNVDKCICGGKCSVELIQNPEFESMIEEHEAMEQDYFAHK